MDSRVARLLCDGDGRIMSQFKRRFTHSFADQKPRRAAQTRGRAVIDEASLEVLDGSRIDYVEDLIGSAFRIVNPNFTASCGCGASFAI